MDSIHTAIRSGDFALIRKIANGNPTEFLERFRDDDFIKLIADANNLAVLDVVIELGGKLDYHELDTIVCEFGFYNAEPYLQYRELEIPAMVPDIWYDEGIHALEWLRNSEIPTQFDADTVFELILEFPNVESMAVFFSNTPSGTRWWSNIYTEFDLSEMMRMHAQRLGSIHDQWCQSILEIVDLFLQNVKTPEEYEIMVNFTTDYPEFELREQSFAL